MGTSVRSIVRWAGKWPLGLLAVAAALLMALNTFGMMLWLFGDRNTVGIRAGLVCVTIPDAGMEFDRGGWRREWARVEWQDPVWRTGSWGWMAHRRRGSGPIDVITPTGAPATIAPAGVTTFQLPLWMIAAPALAISARFWWLDVRRTRRRRRGACLACGYDLSTLPAGRACPECGDRSAMPPNPPAR